MFTLKCLGCGKNTIIPIIDSVCEGPYRCWKYRKLYTVRIENEEFQEYETITRRAI